jgi:DNA modification methylase
MQQVKVLDQHHGDNWTLYHGDSVEVVKGIPDDSIHYTIFSPPFASLYTFSDSLRDMSNCKLETEFMAHFKFLVQELYRVTMPGRLLSFHCCNLPLTKNRNGYIGIHDFRGDLIRLFQECGWIFHSEVCIWKDPVTSMQRTKAIGLLHKQVCKDSAMSRQGIPDYLVTMRKHGDNPEPISGPFEYYAGDNPPRFKESSRGKDAENKSIQIWQNYASPVWMDIRQGDTLQKESARANEDERHISPMQLQIMERCYQLWTNPGDVVLDPFNGIGSSGHVALQMGRKYVGIELKDSYYKCAVTNLHNAENSRQGQLALI